MDKTDALHLAPTVWFGAHRVPVRTMTLRIVSSFRMHATSASFFGLPIATSRR